MVQQNVKRNFTCLVGLGCNCWLWKKLSSAWGLNFQLILRYVQSIQYLETFPCTLYRPPRGVNSFFQLMHVYIGACTVTDETVKSSLVCKLKSLNAGDTRTPEWRWRAITAHQTDDMPPYRNISHTRQVVSGLNACSFYTRGTSNSLRRYI